MQFPRRHTSISLLFLYLIFIIVIIIIIIIIICKKKKLKSPKQPNFLTTAMQFPSSNYQVRILFSFNLSSKYSNMDICKT